MKHRNFRKEIKKAVSDPNLKTALDRSAAAYAKARDEAFEGIDFEALRDELRSRKEEAVARIPELFKQFRREAERIGVTVHTASDAEEANRIVIELAKCKGVSRVAKAKSMLTEEIELNRHLEAHGIQVTETDLGEWICQLAGERPSHFTAPAIHKTREEIADLFSRHTGEKIEADIPTLVEVARKQIRQAFLEADLGITGANIAIAETGTLVIVSNEGNARLVSSLPETHIALVGYDKLAPTIDDAAATIKLLSKSGTGQKMTSYVSFITGPSRTSDIEKTLTLGCHGPKEVHVIFVDNGRLDLQADPEFREALHCIKCGACLNVCPVFRSVGGHVFGHTYVGGIGSILTAFYTGLMEAEDIVNLCAACRRCTSFCPAKVDIPRMVAGLRRKVIEKKGLPWITRTVLNLLANPERFQAAAKLGRQAQMKFLPKAKSISIPLLPFTQARHLPVLADKPLYDRLPEVSPAAEPKVGTVAFYPGCVIEHVYPEIGEAVAGVLTKLGWEVRLPAGQGCCGIPALLKGDADNARKLAAHNVNINDFQTADYIITACPTCMHALKEEFVTLLSGSQDASAAEMMSKKVYDIAEFMIKTLKVSADNFAAPSSEAVTYHDPCHARHGLGIYSEPRHLLRLAGFELVEMTAADECCGFAGSLSISHPDVANATLRRKLKSIEETGVTTVASGCPGCLLQLRGAFARDDGNLQAFHPVELVEPLVRR